MTMGVIAAVAQFEKDLLIERTLSGQARAKAAGVRFGRPSALKNGERAIVLQKLTAGLSISACAREAGVSRATVLRLKTAAAACGGGNSP
jgi:putative DNA-invertase from lambdoid prophage Rac